MNKAEILIVKENGKFTLREKIAGCRQKEANCHVIKMQKDILLVPLTNELKNDDLKKELEKWQAFAPKS